MTEPPRPHHLRIVHRREVLAAPRPELRDYHLACEDVTVELPNPYEVCWEIVEEDRGGTTAARRRGVL